MKRISASVCVTLIAVFAIAGSTTSQSPKPTELESELRSVLHERWAALARNDAIAFGAFLDDDVLIPDLGLVYDKKTLIERAGKGGIDGRTRAARIKAGRSRRTQAMKHR